MTWFRGRGGFRNGNYRPHRLCFLTCSYIFGARAAIPNKYVAYVVSVVMQPLLCALGWALLLGFMPSLRNIRYKVVAAFFLTYSGVMYLEGLLLGYFSFSATQFLPALHFGIIILVPYLLLFALQTITGHTPRAMIAAAIGLFAGCLLISMSDAWFIFQVAVPLCLLLALLFWIRQIALRRFVVCTGAVLVGVLSGYIANKLVIPHPNVGHLIRFDPALVGKSLQLTCEWAMLWPDKNKVALLAVLAGLAANLVAIALLLRVRTAGRAFPTDLSMLCTFVVLSVLCSVLAPIATGLYVDTGKARYLQPLMMLPIFTLPVWLAIVLSRAPRLCSSALTALTVALIAAQAVSGSDLKALEQYADYYPDRIRCIDEELSKRGLHNGIATFWIACDTTMFSKAGIHVNPVRNKLEPTLVLSNINHEWYYRYPPEFLIVQAEAAEYYAISEEFVQQRFGPPAERFEACGLVFLVYNRPQDIAFREQFLNHPKLARFPSRGDRAEFIGAHLNGLVGRIEETSRVADAHTRGSITWSRHKLPPGGYTAILSYTFASEDAAGSAGYWQLMIFEQGEFRIVQSSALSSENSSSCLEFILDRESFLESKVTNPLGGTLAVHSLSLERTE